MVANTRRFRKRRSLLGATKGRLVIRADLTKPTLAADGWRPSL